MEIFRVLVAHDFKPTRNVEFHFYSGKETSLFGSQAIAANYKSSGRSVYAMLNLDMAGYFKPGTTEAISLITDNPDSGPNTFTSDDKPVTGTEDGKLDLVLKNGQDFFANGKEGAKVTKVRVSHSFIQQTIDARRITGSSNDSSIVILGAHEDSIPRKTE
ncbi:unnamed protein product [Rhizoctonia solani]|uniref:Peptide hydrolase n=1 Tax=Rhizoctonia solani TaxID=456999 RepID=A0A8H3CAN7_9AGAM|nr:unnamed protein product [Rhizoctonia solani]